MLVVYGLTDPRTGTIEYVGLTTDLQVRVHNHHYRPHSPLIEIWIDELWDAGYDGCGWQVLSRHDVRESAMLAERMLISIMQPRLNIRKPRYRRWRSLMLALG